jgi:hypothetical protein
MPNSETLRSPFFDDRKFCLLAKLLRPLIRYLRSYKNFDKRCDNEYKGFSLDFARQAVQ